MTQNPPGSLVPQDPFQTTTAERGEFRRLLSGGRLNSYDEAVRLAASAGADEMEFYSYNMALAAAYLGPIHVLEVVTRNALHAQLSTYTNRSDWWDSPRLHLVAQQQNALSAAEGKVDRQIRTRRRPTPRTSDDVVAALDFGFWTGLLGRGNAHAGSPYEREIWQPAARFAFPNYRGNRGDLWTRFDNIREFRNRITHHEPVHTENIRAQTNEILRLTGYVSSPVAAWVGRRTRLRYLDAHPPLSTDPTRTF